MSTIYTDAAGNKYLGDCRWGNHDINYPTIDYLVSGTVYNAYAIEYVDAIYNLINDAGWSSLSKISSWGGALPDNTIMVQGTPIKSDSETVTFRHSFNNYPLKLGYGSPVKIYSQGGTLNNYHAGTFQVSACCSSTSLCFIGWNDDRSQSWNSFNYFGFLENVNPNFSYYTPTLNHAFCLFVQTPTNQVASGTHYIVSGQKNALQTGRAAYTISCSDEQTPGSQWATDMWVYDNNATLGYPVIGRVPNMLLGIGDYTYLKPVKIEGSVFPDGGSPWYLPVGTFSGKVLLMRCYSSVS